MIFVKHARFDLINIKKGLELSRALVLFVWGDFMFSEIKSIFHSTFNDIETIGDIFNLLFFILLVILLFPIILLDSIMNIPIRKKHS